MVAGSRTRSRTSKAEQAAATRLRIVEAATTLFLRDGFLSTTMAAIAREAGVAVQTLYLAFGSKTAILQASFDAALKGGESEGVLEQDWYLGALAEPDGPTALGLFCSGGSRIVARGSAVFAVIRAASSDPEVAELLTHNKQLRYDGFAAIIEALATRPGFAPGLSTYDALGILYTVFSEDTYLLLVAEHGWTTERWQEWGFTTLLSQFFPGAVSDRMVRPVSSDVVEGIDRTPREGGGR